MTQPPGYGPPPEQPATPEPQPGPAPPPPPGHPGPAQPGYPTPPGNAVPPGYPMRPGYPMPSGNPVPPGYPAPPPGYPGGGPMPYGNQPSPYASVPPPGYFRPAPVPVSPAGVPLADFGTRLGSYVIDGLLLGAVNLAFVLPAFFLFISHIAATIPDTGPDTVPDADPVRFVASTFLPLIGLEVGAVVFGLALSYLYSVEVMHRSGQTLGKRILKIRVVPLDPNLRLTRSMAVKRWATEYLPSVFVPFYGLIDGLWQLWDQPFQQTLHDKSAQTIVVKVSA